MNSSQPNFMPPIKPMAISSITSTHILPPSPVTSYPHQENLFHTPTHPYPHSHSHSYAHSHPYYRHSSSIHSLPTTPEEDAFNSPPSSPSSYGSFDLSRGHEDSTCIVSALGVPLTLEERRQRNKAASAKYRQKKNQQQNDMRQMISRISEQNAMLGRQLQELRLENERLRATTDRLRGNMVAKKMLKQWIGRHKEQDMSSQKQDYLHYKTQHQNSFPHDYAMKKEINLYNNDDDFESLADEMI
ncbi:hypothetical protein BDF14DRAFT_1776530 [Spinellus fusiger]|nr:hypothetical protein BDF14DRAFT_1776530 [Spinellus fusiger]